MKSVRDILQNKGNDIWSIRPDSLIFDALKLMADKNVGALVVMDGKNVVGIFSERDYARKVFLKGKSSKETQVREAMTSHVLYIRPNQTLEDCMALMSDKHIRHLPVMEENRLTGVISIGDVVKEVIAEKEFIIGQLTNYITGNR
jgi:CBS domain-containing protein